MPVIFGTPDKFNPSKGYRHVLFGQDAYLTEWELNELQKIQRNALSDVTKALTGRSDGVFSGTVTFNGSTVTVTDLSALVAGELVRYTGTLAASTGDNVYLALAETTIARGQDADLVHPAFPSEETSRRIRYDLSLTKTNGDATKRYLQLGSISGGNLVLTYNDIAPLADIGSDGINATPFKASTIPLADYPLGMSLFQYTTGDAGYPLTNAVVTTYNPPNVSTGYQVITGVQGARLTQRLRRFDGTTWTAWAREDEIELLRARTISAGAGLTGGGDLTANRSLSVSFGGNGAATTVSRSDHNHDTTYAPLTRSLATGDGLTGGGDLSANRTLAVSFGGTGTATTVARSDHNHDTTYAARSMSILAGNGLTGGGTLAATRTLTVDFGGNGSATTVARSDHSHTLGSLTDVTLVTPASNHVLRHDGTKWANTLQTLGLNEDVTLATPSNNHVLQYDGVKWTNRTLATAGIASAATTLTAGNGLTGGGSLAANRTLSVSFAGTGAATTVARSDHNHDTTYVGKTGNHSMSGVLTFGSGQANSWGEPMLGNITNGIEFNFDTDTFRIFGREDTQAETNKLVIQMGDNPLDAFQIEGMDDSTSTPVTLFEIDKQHGASFYSDIYSSGNLYERGVALNDLYAREDHTHALSALTQSASHRTVTDAEKAFWNDKAATGDKITITDTNNYYTATDVEGALAEIGQSIVGISANLVTTVNSLLNN